MGESEPDVLTEFQGVLNDAAGAHAAALEGLRLWREQVAGYVAEAPNPDADFLIGHGPPERQQTLAYQRWRIGSLEERLKDLVGGILEDVRVVEDRAEADEGGVGQHDRDHHE